MQHVNNDMDDLFRRAGEHYPLQTGRPDWEKVANALLEAEVAPRPENGWGKRNLLWLFLLLPLFFICNRLQNGGENTGNTMISETPVERGATAVTGNGQQLKVPENKKMSDASSKQNVSIKQKIVEAAPDLFYQKRRQSRNGNRLTGMENSSMQLVLKSHRDAKVTSTSSDAIGKQDSWKQQSAWNSQAVQPDRSVTERIELIDAGTTGENGLASLQSSDVFDTARLALKKGAALSKNTLSKPSETAGANGKGFYAGLLGSGDLTSVQLQKVSNVGWQLGVIIGYQLRKRWSIETGLYATKKFYYTDAEYFSKSRTYQPPNSRITEVQGTCTMLEVPLNLKYNFALRTRSSWFATAGLSSYFMKKEAYDFLYYYTNTGTYATHSRSYLNASTNLFSVLQLSAGYTKSLSRKTSLRVEPFLKLPLTGLGYGKLYFSSAGLNVGVTRKF